MARELGCEIAGVAGLIDRAREEGRLSYARAEEMWKILLRENRIPEALYRELVRAH